MKILVTGSSGFINGYLIENLLNNEHEVIGIDNFSKYGKIVKSYDSHKNYTFYNEDVKNTELLKDLLEECDQIVVSAAMIGGISYFHEYAYDLLAENEKILASTFDASIYAFNKKKLKKINLISSSMVYENTTIFPTPEGEQLNCPPPSSTYGFQKLSAEFFAKGAYEQYGLPYTIIRPFNCIGIGEKKALGDKQIKSGNINLAMSHVVPDLVQKILKGQDPLYILGDGQQVRHFTYGGDLAEGIRICIENKKSINNDFNISNSQATKIIDLARLIWTKINNDKKFNYTLQKPFEYDVQYRSPSTEKAKKILNFEAKTSLSDSLDEIIPWIESQIKIGGI